MDRKTFILRHGQYTGGGFSGGEEQLTNLGREQSEAAANDLLERGLGTSILTLASSQPRAVETAEIIHDRIGGEIARSDRLASYSFGPEAIQNLDDFLREEVEAAKYDVDNLESLVVVAHGPLVAATIHPQLDERNIDYCQIVEYELGSWAKRRKSR